MLVLFLLLVAISSANFTLLIIFGLSLFLFSFPYFFYYPYSLSSFLLISKSYTDSSLPSYLFYSYFSKAYFYILYLIKRTRFTASFNILLLFINFIRFFLSSIIYINKYSPLIKLLSTSLYYNFFDNPSAGFFFPN